MEILYFEPTDEVTKAIERLREAAGNEVALVLPQGSIILQSIVNLKLIARTAKTAKKNLAIVTVDKIGRNLALQVGIPVFGKIEEGKVVGKVIQKTPQPVTSQALRDQVMQETEELTTVTGIQVHRYDAGDPLAQLTENSNSEETTNEAGASGASGFHRQPVGIGSHAAVTHIRDASGRDTGTDSETTGGGRRLSPKAKRVLLFLVILVVLAAIAALLWFFPKTVVTLNLKGESYETETDVSATANQAAGSIPLLMKTVSKEGSKTVPATGTQNVGDKATGSISLVNQYSTSPQTVPAGSILKTTDGKQFITSSGVVIPGADIAVEGSTTTLKSSGRASVNITADTSGDTYNLSSGTLTIVGISETKENKVFAENPQTTGGSNRTVKIVNQSDIDGGISQLTEELKSQAINDATAQTAGSEVISEATNSNVVSFSSDTTAGTEKENLVVKAKIEVKVLAIDKTALTKTITDEVNSHLASNKAFTIASDGISYTINNLNLAAGTLTLKVKAKGNIAAKVNADDLLKQIRGKTRGRIVSILSQVPLYQSTDFKFDPPWFLKRTAWAKNATTLKIEYK